MISFVALVLAVASWIADGSPVSGRNYVNCFNISRNQANCNGSSELCYSTCTNRLNRHCLAVVQPASSLKRTVVYAMCYTGVNWDSKYVCPPEDSNECWIVSRNHTLAHNSYSCCCTGNYCNDPNTLKIVYKYNDSTRESTSLPPLSPVKQQPPAELTITQASVLVVSPLFVLSFIIIVVYWIYRRYKIAAYDSNDSQCSPSDPSYLHAYKSDWDAVPLMSCLKGTTGRSKELCSKSPLPSDRDDLLGKSGTGSDAPTTSITSLPLNPEEVHRQERQQAGQSWFLVGNLLSDGHLSQVRLCQEISADGRTVLRSDLVVKILRDESLWRNERDIYSLAGLEHSNVVRFIGAEQPAGNSFWILTEHQTNGSLYDYLLSHVVTWSQVVHIIQGVASGLHHLHTDNPGSGKLAVAHRDLKTKNILLNSDLNPCIADLGLALCIPWGTQFNAVQSQVGTRRYMPPEVLQGIIGYDRAAYLNVDIYALALVMWEVLSRAHAPSPGDQPDLCLHPAPDYRPAYDAELAGLSPSLAAMEELVNQRRVRPKPHSEWSQNAMTSQYLRTMEECWDHDSEARLSAGCVAERMGRMLAFNSDSTTTIISPSTAVAAATSPANQTTSIFT